VTRTQRRAHTCWTQATQERKKLLTPNALPSFRPLDRPFFNFASFVIVVRRPAL
jgi:hypothetical protein